MSAQVHTPGPWMAEQVTERKLWKVYRAAPDGVAICQLFDKNHEPFLDAEANARMLAAAPGLLAAGKALAAAACDIHPTAPSSASIARLDVAVNAFDAAVAKAEGVALKTAESRF